MTIYHLVHFFERLSTIFRFSFFLFIPYIFKQRCNQVYLCALMDTFICLFVIGAFCVEVVP